MSKFWKSSISPAKFQWNWLNMIIPAKIFIKKNSKVFDKGARI